MISENDIADLQEDIRQFLINSSTNMAMRAKYLALANALKKLKKDFGCN